MNNEPAQPPVGPPAAAKAGVLLALILITLGVAGVQNAAVAAGWINEASWIEWFATKAEVLRPASWMLYAGIAAAVMGIWLLATALAPRRATHLAVGDQGIWIRPGDVARLAVNTVRGHSEVSSATCRANRRTVKVAAVAVTPDAVRLSQTLSTAIASRLEAIEPAPRVRVHVTTEEP